MSEVVALKIVCSGPFGRDVKVINTETGETVERVQNLEFKAGVKGFNSLALTFAGLPIELDIAAGSARIEMISEVETTNKLFDSIARDMTDAGLLDMAKRFMEELKERNIMGRRRDGEIVYGPGGES